jgi:Putative auto-transporter adhesin, head GIN domain
VRPGAVRRWFVAAAVPLVLLAAVGCLTTGCSADDVGNLGTVTGSGTPATKTFDYTGFTGLRVDSAFRAEVTRGDAFAVSVTVDDNIVQHLRVEVDGDTLRIGLEPGYDYVGTTLSATVTMPSLTALEVTGAAKADVSGFAAGDPLDLQASGDGSVALAGARNGDVNLDVSGAADVSGDLAAKQLGGNVSGAGEVTLTGSAEALALEASGAGKCELSGLTAQLADLQLSGGATATVRVTGKLDVEASGGATLDYYGSPTLGTMDVSGGAKVNRAGP